MYQAIGSMNDAEISSLMIGLLLISRMINQFKFIGSSRLNKVTSGEGRHKTGSTG